MNALQLKMEFKVLRERWYQQGVHDARRNPTKSEKELMRDFYTLVDEDAAKQPDNLTKRIKDAAQGASFGGS